MNSDEMKQQRDRFLAFSFAASDILLEVNGKGIITFLSGAVKSLTGKDEKEFMNKDWLALFDKKDASLVEAMRDNGKAGSKQGPYLITMKSQHSPSGRKSFISGMSLPGADRFYVCISFGSNLLKLMRFEQEDEKPPQLATKDDFSNVVRKTMDEAKATGQDVDVTFLQMEKLNALQSSMKADEWDTLKQSITDILLKNSLGGAAAEIDNSKYAVVHDRNTKATDIEKQIEALAKRLDPKKKGIKVDSVSVEGNLDTLNEREATRALIYTMNQFESQGMDLSTTSLQSSFREYLEVNTNKILNIKALVAKQQFTINFQPIVELQTGDISHYEVLSRFSGTESPYELIVFAEDIGIAPDIDMSVCRQTLKFLDTEEKKSTVSMAVNLSGLSIQSDSFIDSLLSALDEYKKPAQRIIFEITESTAIVDLDRANKLIQKLRSKGNKVCLDDFGAGAASFQYLHKLDIDVVKIDGAYVKTVLTSPRDATMIKNVTQMCHEMDVKVIAEMIETEEQCRYLRDIGVDKGQGYFFGKPLAHLLPAKNLAELKENK